ncbi:putative telomere-associated protein Rif1 [Dioscorea sansibarensis]
MAAAEAIGRQIETIKALSDRAQAYATLLHLQRRSADDPSSMEALVNSSPVLIALLLSDIHRSNEDIAAQALKCLGFIIYHPSIVGTFSDGDAKLVLESLSKLIMTTDMKAICNLGVWCLSIQQFGSDFLRASVDLLSKAVVHALDNPFGSQSITFEAMQAVVQFSSCICEEMKDRASICIPPIYRRLMSDDKRERDVAERCLQKIKFVLYPPPPILSKAIVRDLNQNLLQRMIEMVHVPALKIHTIRAWGWYVRLLGDDAMNKRKFINSLLKVPEMTFSCQDPQIQIASLVAWESLVDLFFSSPTLDVKTKFTGGDVAQRIMSASSLYDKRVGEDQIAVLLKHIKVILIPLKGIVSKKCDSSVHLSCLKTWHYLLHKLGWSVNHPSIATTAFWGILELILSRGPENIFLWSTCIDLLDEFILMKTKEQQKELDKDRASLTTANKMISAGSSFHCKESMKVCFISSLPWEISNLEFYIKMVGTVVIQGLMMTVSSENRILVLNGALRMFRSLLQGIQVEFSTAFTHNDITKFCIETILKFTKEVCEDMISKQIASCCNDTLSFALQFVETIRDVLGPSILSSTLCQIALDLNYIKDLQSFEEIKYLKSVGSGFFAYMDMVSPMVYTTLLHISLATRSALNLPRTDDISIAMQRSLHLIFSHEPFVNLHAVVCFLYMHIGKLVQCQFRWLTVWRVISNGLEENIVANSNLKTKCDNEGHRIVYWLLCYPLFMCFSSKEGSIPLGGTNFSLLHQASPHGNLELESVIEAWKSLYNSLNCYLNCGFSYGNNFVEGLSTLLNDLLDKNNGIFQNIDLLKEKPENICIFKLFGEVAICLMEHAQLLDRVLPKSTADSKEDGCCSPIANTLGFVVRTLGLALTIVEMNAGTGHKILSRIFFAMASLVSRVFLKQDIILLMGILSDPLLQWFSLCASTHEHMLKGSIIPSLQCLWVQILDTLQNSQPRIIFDSRLLRTHASLLEASFDHPHLPISDATIIFWEATYGMQTNLHYPQCLVPVLHKLSMEGRIALPKERLGLRRKRFRMVQNYTE